MEEYVGILWDRWITKTALGRHPKATVWLQDVEKSVGILFRAMGGDPTLALTEVDDALHGAKRHWLARLGGTQKKIPLSWLDQGQFCLPEKIDLFADPSLNRDLYLWLAALNACQSEDGGSWLKSCQNRVLAVLDRFPGLSHRYQRLVEAHLLTRPQLEQLSDSALTQEQLIRLALSEPGTVPELLPCKIPPWPVPLWPHPDPDLYRPPPQPRKAGGEQQENQSDKESSNGPGKKRKRKAERVDAPDENRGLILHRFESIFGWAEFVNVDRTTEEEEETENSKAIADDLDVMSLSQDSKPIAKRVRFDLDLPSEADDDQVLTGERLLPEWDYKKNRLIRNHCHLIPMVSQDAQPCRLPPQLSGMARQIRGHFAQLNPERLWLRRQVDGVELDMEAFAEARADQLMRQGVAQPPIFRDFKPGTRNLATLLLADLSLSTDAWVNDQQRIIDVIRDSLFLFSEAISTTADPFALYGFSSRRRDHIRYYHIKSFDQRYDDSVRGRIQAIKPGYYTRFGAAIRQATETLSNYPAQRKLLLLLTDGKPNDLDQYEGRYGVEDTRMAVLEAQKRGVRTFCVTVDEEAGEYAPYLFGATGFLNVKHVQDLPAKLPLLYAQITR